MLARFFRRVLCSRTPLGREKKAQRVFFVSSQCCVVVQTDVSLAGDAATPTPPSLAPRLPAAPTDESLCVCKVVRELARGPNPIPDVVFFLALALPCLG
jgi:hypothetical protein